MNGEFYIDGKKYISARRGAKLTGYATDYLGQLARAGKLDSRMIGRSWFVCEESLLAYKHENSNATITKKASRRRKASKRARKSAARTLRKASEESVVPVAPAVVPELVTLALPAPRTATETEAPAAPSAPVALPAYSAVRAPHGFVQVLSEAEVEEIFKALSRRHAEGARTPGVELSAAEASVAAGDYILKTDELASAEAVAYGATVPDRGEHAGVLVLRGLGNFLIGSAVVLAMVALVPSIGALYDAAESGTASIAKSVEHADSSTQTFLGRSQTYLSAGLASVASSMNAETYRRNESAAPSQRSNGSFVSRTVRGLFSFVRSTSLAVYDGVNSIFEVTPKIEVHTVKLATDASGEPQVEREVPKGVARQGVAIVPSTGSTTVDREIASYIKDSFSDDVEVVSKNDDGTGVIRPVFKDRRGDDYMYVIVPIPDGS